MPLSQPKTRLTGEEQERIIREAVRRAKLSLVSDAQTSDTATATPPTPVTPPTTVVEGATPTYVPVGTTTVVPVNTQMLWTLPIWVDGAMTLDGALVEVS